MFRLMIMTENQIYCYIKGYYCYINAISIAISIRYQLLYQWLSKVIIAISMILILKKLPSLTRDCNLTIFIANETITNLTHMNFPRKNFFLKASLYFSIQPDKARRLEIFTTFAKIHRSFLSNLKSKETKSQIKVHLSCLERDMYTTSTSRFAKAQKK